MRHPYLLRLAPAAEFAVGLLDNLFGGCYRYQDSFFPPAVTKGEGKGRKGKILQISEIAYQLTESDRYQQIYRHRLVRVDSEGEAVTKGYNILRFVGCVVISAIHFLLID